jgi:DNA-nicking Smr family endonuclease
MPRKSKLSPEDIELFRREAGPVNPMSPGNQAHLTRKRRPSIPRSRHELQDLPLDSSEISDTFEPADSGLGEELSYVRPGVQRTQLRKMDLHGMSSAEARRRVIGFLQDCRRRGERCVRIIHGKGYNSPNKKSVLKNKLNLWLRQCDEVMAFCSAPFNDGGTGAAYVLLATL